MRIWDSTRGRFVSEEDYDTALDKRRKEHLELVANDPFFNEPSWEDKLKSRGVILQGSVKFVGDSAVEVVKHLDSIGYVKVGVTRDIDFNGDKNRTFEAFVGEAMYWYLRNTGLDLKS